MRKCFPAPRRGALPLPAALDAARLDFLPQRVEDLNAVVPKGHPQLATPQRDKRVRRRRRCGLCRGCRARRAARSRRAWCLCHKLQCNRQNRLPTRAGDPLVLHRAVSPRRTCKACMLRPLPRQGVLDFKGGETAALERLQYYLFGSHLIATYFDSRNGMLGALRAGRRDAANAAPP